MRTALAREGVAVVALPGDVALRPATEPPTGLRLPDVRPRPAPSAVEVDRLLQLFSEAGRITILAGAGCAGAHDLVVAVAERLQAPVVHTLRGNSSSSTRTPATWG